MKATQRITYILIGVMCIISPIAIGVLVSISSLPNLSADNDWIGFWGSYAGAIIGGIITLTVMKKSLDNNRKLQEQELKQNLCNHVAQLVADFCIEMMAYRSKWKMLYKQASGQEIDHEKAIELSATTEKPRRILFEVEMLLFNISEANEIIDAMKTILEAKVTQKSVHDTEMLMNSLREKTGNFFVKYTSD